MIINHAHLAKLELGLLVAFDALLSERSVTRAAKRVGITQPAMSHTLARLRVLLSDEVLTRSPEGMRPTPRALALVDQVRTTLAQIGAIVAPPAAFDPATAQATFTLAIPDSAEMLIMPLLIEHLQAAAPGVRLNLRNIDRARVLDDLDFGSVDLAIGVFNEGQTHHKRRVLTKDSNLCVFNPKLVKAGTPISLDEYVAYPHLLTSLDERAHGAVDDALGKLGRKRVIAMTSPRFNVVPFVLRQAPVIATMHGRLARYFGEALGLAVSPPPVELPEVSISMLWHASNDGDPAQKWLRQTIVDLRHGERRPAATIFA